MNDNVIEFPTRRAAPVEKRREPNDPLMMSMEERATLETDPFDVLTPDCDPIDMHDDQ